MQKITALKQQQRDKNRVNLYLDGEFAFGLAVSVAMSLRIGQTVTAAEIEQLQGQDTFEKGKQSALNFLAYRPRSVNEVERNLKKKGYEQPDIAAVVTHLQEIALLDDAEFARYWIEQRDTFKPRSSMALRQELFQKGVPRSVIDQALANVDEWENARRAATKRLSQWTHLERAEFRRKMAGFLQRRGFHYEIIREVTSEMWQRIDSETHDATT